MAKVYFTYGSDDKSMPYIGGWTVIHAPTAQMAVELFKILHPNENDSEVLNCADVYTEDEFIRTLMWKHGNYGMYCQEQYFFGKVAGVAV